MGGSLFVRDENLCVVASLCGQAAFSFGSSFRSSLLFAAFRVGSSFGFVGSIAGDFGFNLGFDGFGSDLGLFGFEHLVEDVDAVFLQFGFVIATGHIDLNID